MNVLNSWRPMLGLVLGVALSLVGGPEAKSQKLDLEKELRNCV